MLREFTLPSAFDGMVKDYVPQFDFPNSLDIPLVCEKIIKLFYGYVKILDIDRGRLDLTMPYQHLPRKYFEFLDDNPKKIEYSTHKEACQHILYLVMTSVSRDKELVIQFLKQSRLYDSTSITDDWIEEQIENYADPRTIHYTLKIMLLEGKFEIVNNSRYRLAYEPVYQKLTKIAKKMDREITSKRQLTRGLNKLIQKEKGKTCIVKSRKFGQATRHIGISNLYPSFYYKRIPTPTEIRIRAKLID